MAKKTIKQEIMQSIANSQVQQVLAEQQQKEIDALQADFAAFQQQQMNPEALMADFNNWKSSQQPAQPVNETPVAKIPTLRETPKVAFREGKSGKANAELQNKKRQQQKAYQESYQRQQQEEQYLASKGFSEQKKYNDAIKASSLARMSAADTSALMDYIRQENQQKREQALIDAIDAVKNPPVVVRSAPDAEQERLEQAISAFTKPATMGTTQSGMKTIEEAVTSQPVYEEPSEELIAKIMEGENISREEALEMIRKGQEQANQSIGTYDESKIDTAATEQAQQYWNEQNRRNAQKQYTPYEAAIGAAGKAVADVVNGPVYLAGKLTGQGWDLYSDRNREEYEQSKEQHPKASGVGTMLGMAGAAYMLGGGMGGRAASSAESGAATAGEAFKAASGEAALNGATKGEAVLQGLNAGGRQLVSNGLREMPLDLVTDIIPTLANDIAEGKSAGEVAANTALNTGLNFGFNSIGDLVSLGKAAKGYKPVSGNPTDTIDELVGAAAKQTEDAAQTIGKQIDEIDVLTKQSDEATQRIDELAKQLDDSKLKEAERLEAINKGYNYDYKGVPTEYTDSFPEPEKLTYKLTGEQVSPEFAAAVRKLEAGEPITSSEYNNIKEIADAKQKASSGDETINIKTPEREASREKWRQDLNNYGSAEEYFDPVDKKWKVRYTGDVERGYRADIVIGLPSSGKSSAVVDPISHKYKSKLLDSDEAKKLIPEFNDGWGAGNVHVESKSILAEAKADAFKAGENVVLPIVGHDYKKLSEEIDLLKNTYGYKVHVHLNELDPNKAAGRNLRRLANDGRFLDLDTTSFKYGDKPSKVFEQLKKEGIADGYTRVSNDVRYGENPVQLEGTEDINFNWRNNGSSGQLRNGNIGAQSSGVPGSESAASYANSASLNGGNDYGTAAYRKGNQGDIGAGEFKPSGQEISGSLEGARTYTAPDGRTLNLRNVVDEDLSKKMDEAGINNFGLKDTSNNPQGFSTQLAAAKEANPNGRMVSNQSTEDLIGAKIFTDDAGTCGVAIKPDGDIVGVHKNPSNTTKGAVDDMLITARANGGDRLDCYGSGLVSKYERDGFTPVAQVEWNEKFRPDDWGDNPPETVYVMMKDSRTNEQVLDEIKNGSFKTSTPEELDNLPMFSIEKYGDNAYDEALKYRDSLLEKQPKQGAFFDGESGLKERGQSVHMRGEGAMQMEGVANEVAADFEKNPDMYTALKNADTKAKAERIYNNSNNPEVEFRALLEKKDPAALPLGHQIAKDYSASGNHEAAAQIYRDMGKALTESGQFSQAAIINMVKNDPLTALEFAEKEIASLNESGAKRFGDKWIDFKLTDDEIKAFENLKPGDEDAIKVLYEEIGDRLGKEYPTTLMEKLIEIRRVAMLFNPRTNVRNVFANPPTLAMRWLSDRAEALGQNAAHLINNDIEVTQSLYGSGIRGRKIATEAYNSPRVKALAEGAGSKADLPNLKNTLMERKQVFKGTAAEKWIDKVTDGGIQKVNEKLFGIKGVQSIPETFRNATYKLLDLGDKPFVKENFVERLGSYIAATGIKNVDDIPDEAIEMAWEEAMKATYKDNSWMVQGIKKTKGAIEDVGNGVIPGLGTTLSQSTIPFVQAPGNIAARMVDYSPLGGSKGIADIISGVKKNNVKQVEKGIEEASKGLTGTALIWLGMELKKAGITTGTYSTDKKQKAFEKQNGFKEFALHVGDNYFTYGWAQPFAQTLMVGTLLQDAIDKSDEYDSDMLKYFGYEGTPVGKAMGVAKEGTKAAVNSWFNESPFSNFADLMKGNAYESTDIAGNIWDNGVSDFASAMIPSVVNATAKVVDTTQRNTYDPSNTFSSFVNSNVAKIPGLSKTLPAKYDTWGREMKYAENAGTAALARYAIPGEYSYDKSDAVDAEINRLFNEATDSEGKLLQDSGVFPTVAPNKVGDKTLNNREVSEYQQDMGQRSRTAVETFVNSDAYQSMGDAEKIEALKKIYGASSVITKRDKFDYPVADNSEYKKAIAAYDEAGGGEAGAKALADYYAKKKVADSSGLSSNSKAYEKIEKDLEAGNTEAANEKIEASKTIQDYGLTKPGPIATYYKAQEVIPSITPEEFAKTYNAMDKDHNQGLKKKDEVIPYMNSQNMSYAEGMRFWKAYANETWKIPELKDGTWK